MTPEFPYAPLPGAYRGFFRKATLWEGIDHILSVSGSRFNEEYRRFYYRDIQAFIVEKHPRAGSLGWWTVLLIALIAAAIASIGNNQPYWWVAIFVLLLILAIRLDLTFRRSCRCSVQTAVSRESLLSLMRRTDASKVISRLQIRIAAEQGELPFEIPASTEDLTSFVIPPDPNRSSALTMLQEASGRASRTSAIRGVNFAVLSFFILLLNSVFTFWVSSGNRLTFPVSWPIAGYLFIAVGLIPIFLALQSLGQSETGRGLRIFLISLIVLSGFRLGFGLLTAGVPAWIPIASRYYANASGGLQLAFAAGGLLLIFAKWEEYRRGEVSSN